MRALTPALLLTAAPAFADTPRVITDIAPVQSLVAMVMDGIAEPETILPAGASPHGFSMRPSDASRLQDADLVFFVGGSLTPWLDDAIETLAADATHVALFSVNGTLHLPYRENAVLDLGGDHDHDHGDHGHDDHAHDKDEHAHDDHAHDADHDHDKEEHAHGDHGHDDHAHDKDEHAHDDHGHDEHSDHASDKGHEHTHDHDHSGEDPHAWLDPSNARIWLAAIADTLAQADPDQADAYRANAAAAIKNIETLESDIAAQLNGAGGLSFIVYHDAYQYFENRFGISAKGSISVSDAEAPGAARVAALRDLAKDQNIACVFAEPQFNPTLINAVFEEANVTVGMLDPLGADLSSGPGLYPALLRQMADAMAGCTTD